MQEQLTEEELTAFRHGRNAKASSVAKNADIHDYRNATGLEALFGYLYLTGRSLAFHVSGGTTEALWVRPGPDGMPVADLAAQSLDLKAGQAVDRVGVMLGLGFPCGPELEKLALQWGDKVTVRPAMKGADCSLSGIMVSVVYTKGIFTVDSTVTSFVSTISREDLPYSSLRRP